MNTYKELGTSTNSDINYIRESIQAKIERIAKQTGQEVIHLDYTDEDIIRMAVAKWAEEIHSKEAFHD